MLPRRDGQSHSRVLGAEGRRFPPAKRFLRISTSRLCPCTANRKQIYIVAEVLPGAMRSGHGRGYF
jgi:hypothetical protein